MLETGDMPIPFSLSQMNNLGMTIESDPKGDKIHVQLLVCTLLQLKLYKGAYYFGLDESHISRHGVGGFLTQGDM